MRRRNLATLIIGATVLLFLTVFFASLGFAYFITRKASILDAVTISQIVVGIAEVIIAFAIGVDTIVGAFDFFLNGLTRITSS
jgi:predicted nucleotidyltransferase